MYANDDVRYAYNRLYLTIIRYEGRAFMVTNVTFVDAEHPLRVFGYYLLDEEQRMVSDDITAFDLTPVPLGFINVPRHRCVTHLSRIPIREDWRQGLRQNNARTTWGPQWWDDVCIARTIENEFPTLKQARSYCTNGEESCAWTRDFAVDGADHILYRTEGVVGQFTDDENNYVLNGDFGWVEESLKEALNE